MCVILSVEQDTKPTLEVLEKCEHFNNDGAGIAWIEDKYVLWKKGLTAEEINEVQQDLEPPYVIHFRWATSGGVTPYLCHPFPITRKVGLDLAGKIQKGKLMVHNGVWTEQDWKKACRKTVIKLNTRMPGGIWSDSRAMAWLAQAWGESVLNTMSGKIAVISPAGVNYYGGSWDEYENTGIFCSNMTWNWDDFGGWAYGAANRKSDDWPYCDWKCETCNDPICEEDWKDPQFHGTQKPVDEEKRFAQEEAAWAAYRAGKDEAEEQKGTGMTLYNNRQVIDMVLGATNTGKKIFVRDHTKDSKQHPCEVCNAEQMSDCDNCSVMKAGMAGVPGN